MFKNIGTVEIAIIFLVLLLIIGGTQFKKIVGKFKKTGKEPKQTEEKTEDKESEKES